MTSPEQVLDRLGCYAATVHGYSMYPLLTDLRDTVYLEKRERLQKYDVVLFRRDSGQLVLHRLLKIDGDTLFMCGDNESALEPIRRDQALAVMTEFTRDGKVHTCDERGYRLYTRLWCLSFPSRRLLQHLYGAFHRRQTRQNSVL